MADEAPTTPPVLDPVVDSPPYTVDVTTSLPLPGVGSDFDDAGLGYWAYGCVTVYTRDRGLREQLIAAPAHSVLADYHRVHAGQCRKVVTGVAVRLVAKPQLPSPLSEDPNEVLLNDEVA